MIAAASLYSATAIVLPTLTHTPEPSAAYSHSGPNLNAGDRASRSFFRLSGQCATSIHEWLAAGGAKLGTLWSHSASCGLAKIRVLH